MKIISINIRGFGGASKIILLRDLLSNESIDFLALQETGLTVDADHIVKLL